MVIGITMVKVLPGQERSVYCALKRRDGIMDVYHVFGEYDFFVVLQADGLGELDEIMEEIKGEHRVILARTILVGWDSGLQKHATMEVLA
ncbi:MAG TPA: Lrp/AsnC ligand binding domain-containing protein [Methanothrix sp.]|nr:Lrp/AsnC ligand binding domain-containing protein [Methanothrix sp.]